MAIQRGDTLGIQFNKKRWVHRLIRRHTYSDTVHIAIALTSTKCMEMHLGGLRVVNISKYKHIRVFRPPAVLRSRIDMAIDQVYNEYRDASYSRWQGIAQGIHRVTGLWMPFRKDDLANCSETGARYNEILGIPDIGDENMYDPGKLVDHILIKGCIEQAEVFN